MHSLYCICFPQIVLWDSITWEKKKSTVLQISVGWMASDLSETNIELDKDETHFLAVHETQLAIYETTTLRRVKQVCPVQLVYNYHLLVKTTSFWHHFKRDIWCVFSGLLPSFVHESPMLRIHVTASLCMLR